MRWLWERLQRGRGVLGGGCGRDYSEVEEHWEVVVAETTAR